MIDLEVKEALTEFISLIWSIFVKTELPFFNITFGQLYIGLFASSVFVAFIHKTTDSEAYKSGKSDYNYEEKDHD